MGVPIENKPYSKEDYERLEAEEATKKSELSKAQSDVEITPENLKTKMAGAHSYLHYALKDVQDASAKLGSIRKEMTLQIEKAHGEALEMEKEHLRLVKEAEDTLERLRTFETEKLGMQKNQKASE